MKLPAADPRAVARFEALLIGVSQVELRPMFGQPAAFRNGHLFAGVFGDQVFLRLAESDRTAADRIPGVVPFAPMAGRPMKEYRVFPSSAFPTAADGRRWAQKALGFALSLPPKGRPRRSK